MDNLFRLYFKALNDSGISYAITGRTEYYPEIIHSDIDIIIPDGKFEAFWNFMLGLQQNKIEWIQIISHEINSHYCIVTLSEGAKHNLIKPDVCSDYYRKGMLFLKADYLLKDRIFNPKGFYQLASEKEFIYYLLKKVDKGNMDKQQFNHLLDQWNENKGGCLESISSFFDKECKQLIREAFEKNEILHLINNFAFLKKGLHQNLRFSVKDFLLKGKNRILRILQPTGLVISFMGPDGCGKTTVVNGVKFDLKEAFRQGKQFHLFPKEIDDVTPTTDPHALKARGYIGSLFKLFYFLGLYTIAYWHKIYPLKVRSTLVIFDRYYHDLWVDPTRYRHGAGKKWIKLIGYFIPKPDLWILLDAPANVIQQRKSEVSLDETTRQVKAYRQLFSQLKNAHIINANQSSTGVIYDAEKIIIDHLKKRTSLRYKNK